MQPPTRPVMPPRAGLPRRRPGGALRDVTLNFLNFAL